MSSLMFYKNPVALDKNKHKTFKLKKQDSYAFTNGTNSIPVAGFEFFEASRSYPIFFVKNKNEEYIPIAILSFRKDGHDLGDKWEGEYVPTYVRRYPFVLSNDGLVLFDSDSPHIQEEEGEALFNDEGEPSEFTNEIMKFLETVDRGYRATEEYVKALKEKELIQKFEGKINFSDGALNLGDVYVVNEKKLHEELNEAEVYDWFKKGWLGWTHAHLHSIGSVNAVLKRARKSAEEAKAAE
jgi:hypothetical protein